MEKTGFLADITNMSNHRILLWEALKLTTGRVVEFGSGYGSTPYLKEYCYCNSRLFLSYDSNQEWCGKTGSTFIGDWDKLQINECDVLFLDHAPGERRKIDLLKYNNIAKIIVIHDSEPTGGGDYRVREHFNEFKYKVELKTNGAWATMLSNFVDLTPCISKEWNEYLIEA